ncbi:MAG: hypothetical protein ACJAVA_000367 [Flavobacteriaceae bacterium]|jgi:hypothetical protein
MNFEESYEKYLVLSESNGTTSNLSTDRSRFAVKYNISQNKIIEWFIENNSTDDNRYLQSIKKPYETLITPIIKDEYTQFLIPAEYFDFINLRVLGSNGTCTSQRLKSEEVKAENVDNLYLDVNSEPSFKHRETFYTLADNNVQVYRKNFDIDSVEMSYYRYPNQVELVDPENPESAFKDENLDFDDKLINRIIFMTASLHSLSSDDPKYQAFKQETIQKF